MNDNSGFGTVGEADAVALQEALAASLARSEDTSLHPMAEDVRNTKPFFDRGGVLYIGQWRLDVMKQRFINRPLQARPGPVFDADVARGDDGWIVGDVTVGRQTAAPRR